MGGPAARLIDDILDLGLVCPSWPFSRRPGALPPRDVRYLKARALALMPAPPAPDEDFDV